MKIKYIYILINVLLVVCLIALISPSIDVYIKCRQAISILDHIKSGQKSGISFTIEEDIEFIQKTSQYSPIIVGATKTLNAIDQKIIWINVEWLEKNIIPDEIFILFGKNTNSALVFSILEDETCSKEYGFYLRGNTIGFTTDLNILCKNQGQSAQYISADQVNKDVYVMLLCKDGRHTNWVKCNEKIFNEDLMNDN